MWSALPGLLAKVEADNSVRALVVRGTDHFSAGADISEFTTLRADPAGARRYGAAVHAGERSIAELPKPTIAADHRGLRRRRLRDRAGVRHPDRR